jgi:hypothetical protein
VFDLASPDASTAQRAETIVPQQALFLMNGPFVVEQARHLAARDDLQQADDDVERIHRLYRHLFGRSATAAEVDKATAFLAEQPQAPVAPDTDSADSAPAPLTAWEQYVHVLLLTNEFVFVD